MRYSNILKNKFRNSRVPDDGDSGFLLCLGLGLPYARLQDQEHRGRNGIMQGCGANKGLRGSDRCPFTCLVFDTGRGCYRD